MWASFWTVTLVAMVAMSCGCSRQYVRTVDEEIEREASGILYDGGLEVDGYVLSGGVTKKFSGRVRTTGPDSLVFWAEQDTVINGSLDRVTVVQARYDRSAVEALLMSEVDVTGTLMVTVGVGVAVIGAVAILIVGSDDPLPIDSN